MHFTLAHAAGAVLAVSSTVSAAAAGGPPPDLPKYASKGSSRFPWPMGDYRHSKEDNQDKELSQDKFQRYHPKPAVDCYYAWENHTPHNYLQYFVSVGPSPKMVWHDICHAIYDQINLNCGNYPNIDCGNLHPGCWCDRNPTKGEKNTAFEFLFPMRKWEAGEDNKKCVQASIIAALHHADADFKNGGCYQRSGSFQKGTLGQTEAKAAAKAQTKAEIKAEIKDELKKEGKIPQPAEEVKAE